MLPAAAAELCKTELLEQPRLEASEVAQDSCSWSSMWRRLGSNSGQLQLEQHVTEAGEQLRVATAGAGR